MPRIKLLSWLVVILSSGMVLFNVLAGVRQLEEVSRRLHWFSASGFVLVLYHAMFNVLQGVNEEEFISQDWEEELKKDYWS